MLRHCILCPPLLSISTAVHGFAQGLRAFLSAEIQPVPATSMTHIWLTSAIVCAYHQGLSYVPDPMQLCPVSGWRNAANCMRALLNVLCLSVLVNRHLHRTTHQLAGQKLRFFIGLPGWDL
jgi:hypothetical protein